MDLPDDHANVDVTNRILDLLDAIRKTEGFDAEPKFFSQKSPNETRKKI